MRSKRSTTVPRLGPKFRTETTWEGEESLVLLWETNDCREHALGGYLGPLGAYLGPLGADFVPLRWPLGGYFGPCGGYFEACGSLSAALLLECYVLLHYFERGDGPNVGLWDRVSLVRGKR